mmetsp:Transcript_16474/g.42007  ORF Transcript_16474/g.42007 Transcript_16474/m.42007 type:complete len:168 (-) Transcript_16474:184-687(-)
MGRMSFARNVALVAALLLAGTATALRAPSALSRRALCAGLIGSAATVQAVQAQLGAPLLELQIGAARLRPGGIAPARCENGIGSACDAAAEASPLIKRLQQQSRDNKAANEADVRRRWEANVGYDEYLKALPQKVVRKEDGSGYTTMSKAEYLSMPKPQEQPQEPIQ